MRKITLLLLFVVFNSPLSFMASQSTSTGSLASQSSESGSVSFDESEIKDIDIDTDIDSYIEENMESAGKKARSGKPNLSKLNGFYRDTTDTVFFLEACWDINIKQ